MGREGRGRHGNVAGCKAVYREVASRYACKMGRLYFFADSMEIPRKAGCYAPSELWRQRAKTETRRWCTRSAADVAGWAIDRSIARSLDRPLDRSLAGNPAGAAQQNASPVPFVRKRSLPSRFCIDDRRSNNEPARVFKGVRIPCFFCIFINETERERKREREREREYAVRIRFVSRNK